MFHLNMKIEKSTFFEILILKLRLKKNIYYWENRAGKSTLINLILGLLKTSSGEILIDKNISEIQKKWLSEIGYVPQNVFLFDDSIKENIILSKKKEPIDVEWLNKVLQISQCNEFIDKLPQTLETKVGEKGYNLSGEAETKNRYSKSNL